MPRASTSKSALPPPVIERKQLVRATPTSTVAIRCPSVRTGTLAIEIEPDRGGDARRLSVTATAELELVDDLYPGRYVMREITIADADGGGLTPELIRSIEFSAVVIELTYDGLVDATIEPDGRVIDHRYPDLTGSTESVVRAWMKAKLVGTNTNSYVAQVFGITPAAASQRIARLRQVGALPPAEGPGARR